jgi:hypothetical protein
MASIAILQCVMLTGYWYDLQLLHTIHEADGNKAICTCSDLLHFNLPASLSRAVPPPSKSGNLWNPGYVYHGPSPPWNMEARVALTEGAYGCRLGFHNTRAEYSWRNCLRTEGMLEQRA